MTRITVPLVCIMLNLATGTVSSGDTSPTNTPLPIRLSCKTAFGSNQITISCDEGTLTNTFVRSLPSYATSGFFRVISPSQDPTEYMVQFSEKLNAESWIGISRQTVGHKYRQHSPQYVRSVLDSELTITHGLLPKTIVIGDKTIIIKEIRVEKNAFNPDTAFSAYLIVDYNNTEKKVGFAHHGSGYYGILTLETERWAGVPEVEGSTGTLFIRYIAVMSINYDISNNDWSFINIGSLVYKAYEYPAVLF